MLPQKRIFLISFILLLACLCFSLPISAQERADGQHGPIRIGIFPFSPMNFIDENGEPQGFNPSLLKEIGRQEKWQLEFVLGNWAQGLERLQNNEIDLMMSVAYSEERAKVMDYTRESALELWGQVFVKPEAQGVNISNLAGRNVGVMRNDISGKNFIKTAQQLNVAFNHREYPDFEAVFRAVQAGEVVAGVAPQHFGLRHASEYDLIPSTIQFSPYSIYFTSKKGHHLALLRTIDIYLFRWKQEKDSFYYRELGHWLGKVEATEHLPAWYFPSLTGASVVVLVLFLLSLLFKRQVRRAVLGLAEANRELEESREKYRSLFEQAGDAIFLLDEAGRFVSVNRQACRVLGYSAEEFKAMHLPDLSVGRTIAEFRSLMSELYRGEGERVLEGIHRRKDGSLLNVSVSVVPVQLQENRFLMAIARDMTLRHKIEECLLFVSRQGWSTRGKEFMESLVSFVAELLKLDFVMVTLVEADDARGRTQGFYANGRIAEDFSYDLAGTPCEQVIGKNVCIYNGDVQERFPEDLMLGEMGIVAYAGVPLWDAEGKAIGLFGVMHKARFNNQELVQAVLQIVSVRVTHELEKQKYLQELGRYQDGLAALVEARTAELETAKNAAEAANRAKSAFLASMSHELRTPLTAILGYSQLLQLDGDIPEEVRSKVMTINRSGNYLRELINDVLEVSQIEAGRLKLNPVLTDIDRLLQEIDELFRLRAEEKGLQLQIEKSVELPAQIYCDEGKLRQALINLLGNALKFTERGFIFVGVEFLKGEILKFVVRDSGAGISADELPLLFQPFEQAAAGKEKGGTGLGLYITRAYARQMGGELGVVSEVGRGSTFTFSCLVELKGEKSEQEPAERKVVGLQQGEAPRTVLVVDDLPEMRSFICQLLDMQGFVTLEAEDGLQACEQVAKVAPDLLIMDLQMTGMDGYAAIRKLRDELKTQVPIIVVSGNVFEKDRQQVLEAGADAFVCKPFEAQELLIQIGKLLGLDYVYQQAEEIHRVRQLQPGDLEHLPEPLRQELEAALVRLDVVQIKELLAKTGELDRSLADALVKMADEYRFDILLELVRGAKREEDR